MSNNVALDEQIEGREAVLAVLEDGLPQIESGELTDNQPVLSLIKALRKIKNDGTVSNGADNVELSASIDELQDFVVNSDSRDIRSYPIHQSAKLNAANYVRSMIKKWNLAHQNAVSKSQVAARNFSIGQIVRLKSNPKRLARITQMAKSKSASNKWFEIKMLDTYTDETVTAEDLLPNEEVL